MFNATHDNALNVVHLWTEINGNKRGGLLQKSILSQPTWKNGNSRAFATSERSDDLHIRAVSPEPSLFAHTLCGSRESLRPQSYFLVFIQMEYRIHIDTIGMEVSFLLFKKLPVKISIKWYILVFILTNCEYPGSSLYANVPVYRFLEWKGY